MKVLQIVEQAFRTTVEEQDDTILWLTRSMRGAGAELSLLLAGHAVHYAVQRNRQPALAVAGWRQREPAELTRDIDALLAAGVAVYAVREDLAERGLATLPPRAGVEIVGREALPALYESVDQVWQW